ncbi:TolB family protein [Kitasatospora sp. NPDC101157]|uniref:TolB family protein n=1 Tax=Kitasatospora sp. NPDC101157 TaxID=3364098 RepID=UPI00382FE593
MSHAQTRTAQTAPTRTTPTRTALTRTAPTRTAPPHRTARRLLRAACALGAAATLALTGTQAAHADPGPHRTPGTERVSVGLGQAQPDGASRAAGLSADGRYAVFTSAATNLVPGDTNGKSDVFVRDLRTGRTERVDTGPDGAQADGASFEAAISADGRYVAFSSSATNLAPGAGLGYQDVYVHDRRTGETTLVSVGEEPGEPQKDRSSGHPSISRDGRYIAFQSNRSDLAPGTVTWQGANIYVHDLRTGENRLVSTGADGKEANGSSASPVISADGGTVAFISKATNIIAPGQPGALSPDAATRLGAESDRESDEQFVHDSLQAPGAPSATTSARTTASPGTTASPRTTGSPGSADHPQLLKPHLYPLYVRDLRSEETTLASPDGKNGWRGADYPSLSADGRYAVYSAWVQHGDNWPDHHFEVYVRDLAEGTETLVSAGLPGTTTTGDSLNGRMTADGRWVYFDSTAANLVPGDTNGAGDVFRRDLRTGRTERVSLAADGSQTAGASYDPYVDARGTTVVFTSEDGTLVPGDTNRAPDVFARRLPR